MAIQDTKFETKVRNYILDNFLFSDDQNALANDESFIEKGIIDSTGILEVILFLESEFDIAISENEMIRDNLDSVNSIVSLLESKSG